MSAAVSTRVIFFPVAVVLMNFAALSTSERPELSVDPETGLETRFRALRRTYLEVLAWVVT